MSEAGGDINSSTTTLSPIVADPDALDWDDEADLVVVGFGGAGAAAALQGRECGLDVLAIDRFGGGGATAYSGGVIYAGQTRQQEEAGYPDSADDMYRYLDAEGNALSPEALRRFCEESPADMAWLERHGIPYGGNVYLPKTAYPAPGHWLFFSGNERSPRFAAVARPAPRGHLPVTPGFGGHLHFARLRDAGLALGVRTLLHAPVRRLVLDPSGRAVGVEASVIAPAAHERHEQLYKAVDPWKPFNAARAEAAIAECHALEAGQMERRLIRARRGIVLSSGGFVYNLQMLHRHRPLLGRLHAALLRLGSMGCDGSGIALGQSAGGATGLMDRFFLGRPLAPPEAFIYGVLVNSEGRRFVNEDAYQSMFGDELAEQPDDGRAFLIVDAGHFWKGVRQSLFPGKGLFKLWGAPALLNIALGGTRRGATLAKLARRTAIDAATLEATLAEYNRVAATGEADPFGKAPDKLVPLAKGPFYAINCSLDNKYGPTFAFSLGGLLVDDDSGLVRRDDGRLIAGLYAAGRSAVGLCSKGYMTGLAIADTVFSGRRAARHAAGQVVSNTLSA